MADQLTLSQPGGRLCPHITTGNHGFSDFSTALIIVRRLSYVAFIPSADCIQILSIFDMICGFYRVQFNKATVELEANTIFSMISGGHFQILMSDTSVSSKDATTIRTRLLRADNHTFRLHSLIKNHKTSTVIRLSSSN